MKCLLVDDEAGIREGLAMLLRRRGFEVETAGDCAAARRALDVRTFDVVVTDWRLPDGTAGDFAASCTAPVVAMSGHPEEVVGVDAIRAVLSKPVRPTDLVQSIEAARQSDEVDGDAAAIDPTVSDLALDVQRIVRDVAAQLSASGEPRLSDDGVFVVCRWPLGSRDPSRLTSRGGDLRVVDDTSVRELELRLCRDGRPDADVAMVPITDAWPDRVELALDCAGVRGIAPARFAALLERVARRNSDGGRVCLVNVPDEFEAATRDWETTHDMPMRDRVGPRLSGELAELWS